MLDAARGVANVVAAASEDLRMFAVYRWGAWLFLKCKHVGGAVGACRCVKSHSWCNFGEFWRLGGSEIWLALGG